MVVPYRSNGSARAMMARALSSVGTRAAGRMPLAGLGCRCGLGGAGGRAPAPGPGLLYQSPGALPFVPYEAAKRMSLGALGESTVKGASQGASAGASVGSVIPIIGTAVGAILGGIGGAIASAFTRQDQEVGNFDQAVALWQVNPNNVYNIANKYLPLAGLFDLSLKSPHIPIYQRYGRMGEQKFVTDLVNQVYSAAQRGQISGNDTPLTIMSRIIQPWIDSWGYGPMVDPHADLIQRLIVGMIADYVAGRQRNWTARGGDYPFSNLPIFSLPTAAPTAAPSTPAPLPAPTPAPALAAAPATVLTTDGSTVQPGQNAALRNSQGQLLWFSTATGAGGNLIYLNGTLLANGGAVGAALSNGAFYVLNQQNQWWQWNGSTFYPSAAPATPAAPAAPPVAAAPAAPASSSCTAPLVWNGTQCVAPPATPPPLPLPPATVTPTTAQVPSGFNQVAADQAGNPIFADSRGVLYSWNGTAMQQFTGQLATNSSQAAQMQAAIQAALAQGYSAAQAANTAVAQQQAAGAQVPPALLQQATQQADTTAAAPTSVSPTAAGVGGFLSGSTGLIAVGLTLVGLMFATARPVVKGAG